MSFLFLEFLSTLIDKITVLFSVLPGENLNGSRLVSLFRLDLDESKIFLYRK
jgi:hypothetical protein